MAGLGSCTKNDWILTINEHFKSLRRTPLSARRAERPDYGKLDRVCFEDARDDHREYLVGDIIEMATDAIPTEESDMVDITHNDVRNAVLRYEADVFDETIGVLMEAVEDLARRLERSESQN